MRGLLADMALEVALIRLRREDLGRKDWETQPRAPAGQSDGGQWVPGAGGNAGSPPTAWTSLRNGQPESGDQLRTTTDSATLEDGTRVLSLRIHAGRRDFDEKHAVIAPDGESRIFETSGTTQTIRDGETGEVLSRTTLTPTELISEPIAEPAFFQGIPFALQAGVAALRAKRTIELALSLFAALSARKGGFGTVLGLTAHEFVRGDQSSPEMVSWVGQLNQQKLDAACPRNGEVRAITNDVTRSVRASGQYRDKIDFGNKVHLGIKKVIEDRHDPNFIAEILLDPAGNPGKATGKGNVRLDLLENVVISNTACVYDYKTGAKELSMSYAARISAIFFKIFDNIKRIMVVQVRPDL